MPNHAQDFSNLPKDFCNPESANSTETNERKKQMKTKLNSIYPAFALVALACFGLSPMVQALLPPPPPDGGYPNRKHG